MRIIAYHAFTHETPLGPIHTAVGIYRMADGTPVVWLESVAGAGVALSSPFNLYLQGVRMKNITDTADLCKRTVVEHTPHLPQIMINELFAIRRELAGERTA